MFGAKRNWKVQLLWAGFGLAFSASSLTAALPADPPTKAQLIGQPVSLTVQPEALTLCGPRDGQQIVVTGCYADGSVRDLTPFCDVAFEAGNVAQGDSGGFLVPRPNGTSTLVVKVGGQTARVPVTVKDLDKPQAVGFRHEFIAALNVGGCNQGACHGTPSGKNGFRLSLRGYDPAADYIQLTRDVLGRRTDRLDPEASLILQKALARVPHEGGLRFQPASVPAQILKSWLAEGLKDDPADLPPLNSVEILPGS